KNKKLQSTVDELRAKRKTESHEWRKERSELTESLNAITSELERQKADLEKKTADYDSLSDECNSMKEQIKELTDRLEQRKPVLLSTLLQNNAATEAVQEPPMKSNKVILLGETIPSSILKNTKVDIELIANQQIEDFLKAELRVDEIWMLTFQISPQKQRKVRHAFTPEQLIEFATIPELQTYINTR